MHKIGIWGNCQAGAIAKVLKRVLPTGSYQVEEISNNVRTDAAFSADTVLTKLDSFQTLIFQPLGSHHGSLSADNIQKIFGGKNLLTFAYQFNSGIQGLGYAPMSQANSYGEIYGGKIILDLLKSISLDEVNEMYFAGKIDFDLNKRFNYCLSEVEKREELCDLKTASFVRANYQSTQLFLTHNHPTLPVIVHICSQILDHLKLVNAVPFERATLPSHTQLGMEYTGAPYTPHDQQALGYRFGYHSDWQEKGKLLISRLFKHHILGEAQPRARGQYPIELPDTGAY